MRLIKLEQVEPKGKGHFIALAARAMRRILIERARQKAGPKRGGDRKRVELEAVNLGFDTDPTDLLALDEVLEELEARDPRMGQVVNLRFFAGLSVKRTGGVLGVSKSTSDRDWLYIRFWLFEQLHA